MLPCFLIIFRYGDNLRAFSDTLQLADVNTVNYTNASNHNSVLYRKMYRDKFNTILASTRARSRQSHLERVKHLYQNVQEGVDRALVIDRACDLPDEIEGEDNLYVVRNIRYFKDALNTEITAAEQEALIGLGLFNPERRQQQQQRSVLEHHILFALESTLRPSVHIFGRPVRIVGRGSGISVADIQSQQMEADYQRRTNAPVTRTELCDTYKERLSKKRKREDKPDYENTQCCICMDAFPDTMLAPCSHQCVCLDCARNLMERDDQKKQCPKCREEIKDLFIPLL